MTPILETSRLLLYGPDTGRALAVARHVMWLTDKETMKYSGQRHEHHSIKSQLVYIASFDGVHRHYWEIATKGRTIVPIGTITAYRDFHNKTANLGLLIRRKSWGHGYGCEAWQAVMDWLFWDGIRKIEAGCYSKNIGMLNIFLKSNMTIEGRRRGSIMLDDDECDIIEAGKFKHDLSTIDRTEALAQQARYQRDGGSIRSSRT